jgi:Co/Zn/Cd efflux system component
MGAIGLLALAVNLGVAGLLYRYRSSDSQAMSVWLCTRNDCIANIAVMLAGAGVWASATAWPDNAVAAIIVCFGLSSAVRIIRQPFLRCAATAFRVAGRPNKQRAQTTSSGARRHACAPSPVSS